MLITDRRKPICDVPDIGIGNKPIDGGYYLLNENEKDDLIAREPKSKTYIKRWYGATEYINDIKRYCLWLSDAEPQDVRAMPHVTKIVDQVRRYRLAEINAKNGRKPKGGKSSKDLADTPMKFHVSNLPKSDYLLIPRHSSELRQYIPMGFMSPDDLSGDANLICDSASKYHLGIMQSAMHMAWVNTVCGRIKSDYRYSKKIVYNNFPWPIKITKKDREKIESATENVLSARSIFPKATLADLYDPLSMPSELVKAHKALDRVVDAAYVASGGKGKWSTEAERVAFLFDLHNKILSTLDS